MQDAALRLGLRLGEDRTDAFVCKGIAQLPVFVRFRQQGLALELLTKAHQLQRLGGEDRGEDLNGRSGERKDRKRVQHAALVLREIRKAVANDVVRSVRHAVQRAALADAVEQLNQQQSVAVGTAIDPLSILLGAAARQIELDEAARLRAVEVLNYVLFDQLIAPCVLAQRLYVFGQGRTRSADDRDVRPAQPP